MYCHIFLSLSSLIHLNHHHLLFPFLHSDIIIIHVLYWFHTFYHCHLFYPFDLNDKHIYISFILLLSLFNHFFIFFILLNSITGISFSFHIHSIIHFNFLIISSLYYNINSIHISDCNLIAFSIDMISFCYAFITSSVYLIFYIISFCSDWSYLYSYIILFYTFLRCIHLNIGAVSVTQPCSHPTFVLCSLMIVLLKGPFILWYWSLRFLWCQVQSPVCSYWSLVIVLRLWLFVFRVFFRLLILDSSLTSSLLSLLSIIAPWVYWFVFVGGLVLDSGFLILGSWFLILDSLFWVFWLILSCSLNLEFLILDSRSLILDFAIYCMLPVTLDFDSLSSLYYWTWFLTCNHICFFILCPWILGSWYRSYIIDWWFFAFMER